MLKSELVKEYVELKFFWWNVVDGKQHEEWKKKELIKTYQKANKKHIEEQLQLLKDKIANANKLFKGGC